jgi:hypothetical protein
MKAKRSSGKREHLLNDKSENWSVLGNEKWSVSSPKEICWVPTIYCIKQKENKTESKSKDAPRKTHRI